MRNLCSSKELGFPLGLENYGFYLRSSSTKPESIIDIAFKTFKRLSVNKNLAIVKRA